MSYERDRDRHLRGVGAIAALDANNPVRRKLRARRQRLLEARDRQLAQMTFRPGGGMGRVDLSPTTQVTITGGSGDVRRPRPPSDSPKGSGGPAYDPNRPTRLWGGAGSVLQQPTLVSSTGGRWIVSGTSSTSTPTGGARYPGLVRYPTPPTLPPPGTINPTPGGSISPSSGGGGGGSGGGSGGGGGTYPGVEPPVTPDIPDDVGTETPGIDLKKVAIVGGLLVGAWYLFFRKKPGNGGTP